VGAGERLPGTPEPMHVWRGADGLRIAGDSWGDPAAPLVILGHGGGQTRHAWKITARRFADAGFYAVAYDVHGHGDSDWSPEGDYSIESRVRSLRSLVAALGARRPILVGASLSAESFLLAVGEGSVDAAALVLADFAPRTQEAGYERNRNFMTAHANGFASLEEVSDAIAGHAGGERPRRLDGLAKVVRKGADGRFHWHWDQRLIEWRVREYPRRHARMVEASRRIRVPTLLVRGGKSDILTEEGAQEFLQLVPGAKYVVLPGVGHMMAGDRNDGFGRVAVEFVSSAVRGSC
jgi:non-heme chloroperoxidase